MVGELVKTGARWPERLLELAGDFSAGPAGARPELRQELWLIIHTALLRFFRFHAGKILRASREDIEDLASQHSLELVQNLESGKWKLEGRSAGEVFSYLSTVARNSLISARRREPRPPAPIDRKEGFSDDVPSRAGPEGMILAMDFSRALLVCLEPISPRNRLIWFLRAMYQFSTKEIASHPLVRLEPGHVDVVMQRTRQSMQDCLRSKGFDGTDIPAGAFVEIWRALHEPVMRGSGPEGCSLGPGRL